MSLLVSHFRRSRSLTFDLQSFNVNIGLIMVYMCLDVELNCLS